MEFSTLAEHLEREVLDIRVIIRLNLGIVELVTNKIFCIKNTRYQVLVKIIQGR